MKRDKIIALTIIFGYLGIASLSALFLGYLRVEHIESVNNEEYTGIARYGWYLFNILFLMGGFTLAYFMYNPNFKLIKLYNRLVRSTKKALKKIEWLMSKNAKINDVYHSGKLKIKNKYEVLKDEVRKVPEDIEIAMLESANEESQYAELHNETINQIDSNKNLAIESFRSKILERAERNTIPEYWKENIGSLKIDTDVLNSIKPQGGLDKEMLDVYVPPKVHQDVTTGLDNVEIDNETDEAPEISQDPKIKQIEHSSMPPIFNEQGIEYHKKDEVEYSEIGTDMDASDFSIKDFEELLKVENLKNNKENPKSSKAGISIKTPTKIITGLALAIGLNACNPNVEMNHLSFIKDETPGNVITVNSRDFKDYLGVSKDNLYNGATFEFTQVTNISRNKVSCIEIPMGNPLLDNEYTRMDSIAGFYSKLDSILIIADSDQNTYDESKIYRAICNAARKLNKKAGKKTLIIGSDMLQNDKKGIMLYDKYLSEDNYDELINAFEKDCPLSSLVGISIIILNRPLSSEDDYLVNRTLKFWEYFFTKKGCSDFEVVANL